MKGTSKLPRGFTLISRTSKAVLRAKAPPAKKQGRMRPGHTLLATRVLQGTSARLHSGCGKKGARRPSVLEYFLPKRGLGAKSGTASETLGGPKAPSPESRLSVQASQVE